MYSTASARVIRNSEMGERWVNFFKERFNSGIHSLAQLLQLQPAIKQDLNQLLMAVSQV